jgi:hypothetical protein
MLKSFELSKFFINSAKNLTLLESDAEFLGRAYKPSVREMGESNYSEQLQIELEELNSDPYF